MKLSVLSLKTGLTHQPSKQPYHSNLQFPGIYLARNILTSTQIQLQYKSLLSATVPVTLKILLVLEASNSVNLVLCSWYGTQY